MNNFKTMDFFLIANKIKQNNSIHILFKLWDKIKYGPRSPKWEPVGPFRIQGIFLILYPPTHTFFFF